MTLEELFYVKPTRATQGRPAANLTDKKWQDEFAVMKLYITPYKNPPSRFGGKSSKESGMTYENTTYHGATNWQSYCTYMNDVLRNIKAGNTDFVYYGYQIADLLRFYYNTLRTRYCDGYWEVWLER